MDLETTVPDEYGAEYLDQGRRLAEALIKYNTTDNQINVVLSAAAEFWAWLETESDLRESVIPAEKLEVQPAWQKYVRAYRVRKLRQKNRPLGSSQAIIRARASDPSLLNFTVPLTVAETWPNEWAIMSATMFIQAARNSVMIDETLTPLIAEDSGSTRCQQRAWCLRLLQPMLLAQIVRGNMPMNQQTSKPVLSPFFPNLYIRMFPIDPIWTADTPFVRSPVILFLCRAVRTEARRKFVCLPVPMVLPKNDVYLVLDNLLDRYETPRERRFERRISLFEMRLFCAVAFRIEGRLLTRVLNPHAPLPANHLVRSAAPPKRIWAEELDVDVFDTRKPLDYQTDSDDDDSDDSSNYYSNSAIDSVKSTPARKRAEPLDAAEIRDMPVGGSQFFDAQDETEHSASSTEPSSPARSVGGPTDNSEEVFKFGTRCYICYRSFKTGHLIRHEACRHTFHASCLSGFLLHTPDRLCPLCKKFIPHNLACEIQE